MVTENTALCTGCGVCAAVCPKDCLKIQLNEDGFYVPYLVTDSCINCGICDKVCPKEATGSMSEPVSLTAVVAKDENTLKTTSSGGLCYEIAKKALEEGKKVCGCVYDYDSHRAVHKVIETEEELEATKGSKYFQSYTPEAFKELFDGNEWVVFGTPCQIAAIDKAANIKKKRDKLILVDFFCHGTPSMHLWDKYVKENGGKEISKIDFRSKEFGWHSWSLKFSYKDGKTKSDSADNIFYKFFFSNLCLNDSCYKCDYKAYNTSADIRVGDFWGTKYKDDRKGVSCSVAMTERGAEVIEKLKNCCTVTEAFTEDVLEEQMVKSPVLHKERTKVMKALKSERSLEKIYNTTVFTFRLKGKIKSMIRR